MLTTNRPLRTARYVLPDVESGYQLDPAHSFFSAVLPLGADKTNLVTNPVLGVDTTGYTAVGGTATRDTAVQKFGIASLKVTPTAATTDGAYYGTVSLTAGTQYFASIWFKGAANRGYTLSFATTGGAALGQVTHFVATGFWQRVSCAYLETSSTTRRIYILKDSQTNTAAFWVGALDCEQDQVTTHIDGDQRGFVRGRADYYWTGTPHASTSVRIGQSRAGGELVSFDRFAFRLLSIIGLGLGGIINQFTPLARGGAYYQGTVIADRQFTLVGQIDGGGLYDLQQKRQALIDLFKPDVVTPDQPVVLRFQPTDDCGNPLGDEQDIVCVYEAGLSGQTDNLNSERLALAYHLYLPFVTQEVGNAGASLGYQTSVSSVNRIISRSPAGLWAAMGTGVSSLSIRMLVVGLDGKIYVGGDFASAGGVSNTAYIAVWNPATGTWAALGTGGAGGISGVLGGVLLADGSIVVCGDFTGMGGVANTKYIAKWTGAAWASISSGATGTQINDVEVDNTGVLYAVGLFSNLGGTAAANIAKMSTAGSWSAIGSGLSTTGNKLKHSPTGDIYVGGYFVTANGVTVNGIAKVSSATFVALGSGLANPGVGLDKVDDITFMPDGSLVIGGLFSAVGGIAALDVARWNGVAWSPLGAGVNNECFAILALPDGTLLAGGNFTTAGSLTLAGQGFAVWTGSAWVYNDMVPAGSATGYTLLRTLDGTIYYGYDTAGTVTASVLTTISNTGSAATGPRFTFTGPGTLYTLKNYTTGKAIYFNLALLAGETAVLDLTDPSNITFVSTFRGNILNTILAGSQLSDFQLAPGANAISLFIAGSTTAATAANAQWRITNHSLDGAIPGKLLP